MSTEYFVPGYGISRQIIFSQLHLFLGPSASVRPYSYQGREGYLISSPGITLTRKQIEDLQTLSKEYERQCSLRMTGTSDPNSEAQDTYINEPIPVAQRERRRRPAESYPRRSR